MDLFVSSVGRKRLFTLTESLEIEFHGEMDTNFEEGPKFVPT